MITLQHSQLYLLMTRYKQHLLVLVTRGFVQMQLHNEKVYLLVHLAQLTQILLLISTFYTAQQ